MKNFSWIALLLFLAVPMAVNAQQAKSSPNLLVAVVDLPSLIKSHPITVDEVPMIQQEFQKDALNAKKTEMDYKKQLEQITQEYKYGTPQFEEAVRPIKEGMRQLEVEMQDKQASLQNRLVPLQYKVYTDIQKAVETVARQKGIIIVHAKIKIDRTGISEELAAVQEADANATLVWNRPECEVTEDVKTVLAQIAGTPKSGEGGSGLNNLVSQAAQDAAGPSAKPAASAAQTANAAPRKAPQTANRQNAAKRPK